MHTRQKIIGYILVGHSDTKISGNNLSQMIMLWNTDVRKVKVENISEQLCAWHYEENIKASDQGKK